MSPPKGYVVRRDEIRDGGVAGSLFSSYGPSAVDGEWGHAITTERGRAHLWPSIAEAEDARWAMRIKGARIFAVADDGTETALPSYEDAIGQRNAFRDHLAIADKRANAAVAERDALLTLLDRVDCDGKSLPGELREDIGKALDAAWKAGWRSNDADRAEHACPDCGKDARVDHEGME